MPQYTLAQKLAYYKKKAGVTTGHGSYRSKGRRLAPRRAHYAGHGAYTEAKGRKAYAKRKRTRQNQSKSGWDWGKIIGDVSSGIGTAVKLGSAIMGMGDYEVKSNVLLDRGNPASVVNPAGPGACTIRHKEYIGDIITGAAGTFNLQSFPVNPAMEVTFPWLSQIAANFEQYRIEGMLFEYRTMSSDALNSTNTALGQVIMATDYNAANPPFSQKSEMENYEFGASCKPSVGMVHPIECARLQTSVSELYTRSLALPTGQDIRLYDLGNFEIATNGFQASNVNIGELWVTYQVTFLKAKLFAALGNYNDAANYNNLVGVSGGVQVSNVFGIVSPQGGLTDVNWQTNSLGITLTSGTGGVITFPQSQIKQTYLIQVAWNSVVSSAAGAISYAFTNCVEGQIGADAIFNNNMQWPRAGQSVDRQAGQVVIQTAGGGKIPRVTVFNDAPVGSNLPPDATQVVVTVIQLPNLTFQ